MNKSYSKIRHIQNTNLLLERRFLIEQVSKRIPTEEGQRLFFEWLRNKYPELQKFLMDNYSGDDDYDKYFLHIWNYKVRIGETEKSLGDLFYVDELKQDLLDRVNTYGIYDTADWYGMDTYNFINKFGFELKDEKIIKLIDFYMKNRFRKIYNLEERKDLCTDYETPDTFLRVVVEAINEFCYNNFNFSSHYNIDEENMEYENLFYQMEHYVIKKYGKLIKDTFIENCGI